MDIRLRFFGGAGTVTGSKYLVEIDDKRILVDCGLFQGLKELRLRNWDKFPIDPHEIDAVVLTHAHLDHSGYLPRLVRNGFSGPIFCTDATFALLEILLKDSAKLQMEEAEFARKKGYSKHAYPMPLYDTDDVEKVLDKVVGVSYNSDVDVHESVRGTFHNASHILGAAIVELVVKGDAMHKTLVFSGDLGRYDDPILYPPEPIKHADILLIESTYGDRRNPAEDPAEALAEAINTTFERGGCVVIPAFAVGRTQTILFYLKELLDKELIDEVPIYMDSPMAITSTDIYRRYFDYHKLTEEQLEYEESFLRFRKNLHIVNSQADSIRINDIASRAIILSASGMLSGGRILHHLFHRLPRENDTLLLVGYQAEGTRGWRIVNGEKTVRIFGKEVKVNCEVKQLNGLSAHADADELWQWLSYFQKKPKYTFVVHGEENVSKSFANRITSEKGWNTIVPLYLESFRIFQNI